MRLQDIDVTGFETLLLDRDGVVNRLRPDDYVKKWEEFEIPKEWISKREISTIIAEIRLGDCTQNAKYKKVVECYEKYYHIPKPIIVDKNGFLLDGFYSVIFAKNNSITSLPAIELENVEVIM